MPLITLMPSAKASEPAQPQTMSLSQRYRSCPSADRGAASSVGTSALTSPYAGSPKNA
nr:hypothetical protein [Kribbella pratensis]